MRRQAMVTGTAFDVTVEAFRKALALLKEAVPKAHHVAVLSNPTNPAQALATRDLKVAAKPLGLRLLLLEVRGPDEFHRVFAEIAKARVDALFVVAEAQFVLHRMALADLALTYGLPTMHAGRFWRSVASCLTGRAWLTIPGVQPLSWTRFSRAPREGSDCTD